MNTLLSFAFFLAATYMSSEDKIQSDTFNTQMGNLTMSFVGHGTLMFELDDLVIHIDPVGREADYSKMPDADLILITHQHGDHLDANAIAKILKKETKIIMTSTCFEMFEMEEELDIEILGNGDNSAFRGIKIEAIPAYNIVHKRKNGAAFHPEGEGNGYVLNFGDFQVLVAGDTENIPEIKSLKNIDVAFLPMNLPYTMTPEMVADAAKSFKPRVLYPYHFGSTDTDILVELLKEINDVEVRVRNF